MNLAYSFLIVATTALTTLATRATPFILFARRKDKVPNSIIYLSNLLPPAVMAILVVYCLRDVTFSSKEGYLANLIAVSATVIIHLIKRNTLLSIFVGVILYMVLVQRFML